MELVLDNISCKKIKNQTFRFFDAKITSVIGGVGSGKTILADLIATLRKPESGSFIIGNQVINLNDDNVNYNNLRFDIGIVLQNFDLQLFQDTVYDRIFFELEQYNYKNNKKHIIDALKLVGLKEDFLNRKLSTLSNGEKFLVSLAATLAHNPKILVLDDPTCFIDDKLQEKLIHLLKRMKTKFNRTIIILSNDVDFIHSISDYVYVLDNGKIINQGNKYDVFTSDKLDKINIGTPDIIKFGKLVRQKLNIDITYRDDVNDLIKDIYFYVEQKNRGSI